jgi:hypothetical protein
MERIRRQRKVIIAMFCVMVMSTLFGILIGLNLNGTGKPDDPDAFPSSGREHATPVSTPRDLPPLFRIVPTAV